MSQDGGFAMAETKTGVLFKAIVGALSALAISALTGLWVYSTALASDVSFAGRCVATNTEAIHRIDEKHRDDMMILRDELKLMRDELVRIRVEQSQTNQTMVGVLAELKTR